MWCQTAGAATAAAEMSLCKTALLKVCTIMADKHTSKVIPYTDNCQSRHLVSLSHGRWGLCVPVAFPAKMTLPAKLGPLTWTDTTGLQHTDAPCTQQSLA